jgi:uncharacterized protein (DUF1800 family)
MRKAGIGRGRFGALVGAMGLGLALVTSGAQAQVVFSDSFEYVVRGPDTDVQAARFLDQATFGGRVQDIAQLRAQGYQAWIDAQFNAPVSLQTPYLDWIRNVEQEGVYQSQRQEAWWIHSAQLYDPSNPLLTHNDQLRQRVTFALSEIMVVSDRNATLLFQPWALSSYYDMLAENAFGNFRDLLEGVTLHPAMGKFLSMLGNRKNDPALNIRPDENYAREILQLFSIGLVQLNQDGTPVLVNGQPVPTYNQDTVRGFAHVFTGWNFINCTIEEYGDCAPGNPYEEEWVSPMEPIEAFHDNTTAKQLLVYPGVSLPGGVLAAGGNAQQELDAALDNIFNHPNVGPFIAKHLIQRLVTSNPTPAYVGRVAAAFNNNGAGVRGDMRAVIRAVLFDYEARFGHIDQPTTFGKLREPLTKLVRLWRIAPGVSQNGRVFRWSHIRDQFGQLPLSAPSVFNFFKPNFAQPGPIRDAGLVSPEFQIATDTQLVSAPNELGWRIMLFYVGSRYSVVWENGAPVPEETLMDYSALKTLAANPAALVDHLNLVMMSGSMSTYMRDLLITRLNGPLPDSIPGEAPGLPQSERVALHRVQQALYLIANSPEFNIQK